MPKGKALFPVFPYLQSHGGGGGGGQKSPPGDAMMALEDKMEMEI